MKRQEKTALIDSLADNFSKSIASVVVEYKGLTVAQMQDLRKSLRASGAKFKIAKARLAKRAVDQAESAQELTPFLHDQIGFVFIPNELSGSLKTLYDFSKENKALALVAGTTDSMLMDKDYLVRLAVLPSREVLLAQLAGVLKAPIAKLAFVCQKISEKKQ